ncbi:hypothetical protein D187_001092 [Cystobacter fuscus DSM 2262]|uniref:Uncharacterized protein n=1 Tax=Cystobacter fuscus (strain ATCC 25194 / DSM 2262 / NBRC 100088 / M29) TaxID=1242864 RepID=S9QJ46_CYSF2|nr:hypothetical protein D187_001092 [Cystobacter fuscus DSM 2262]
MGGGTGLPQTAHVARAFQGRRPPLRSGAAPCDKPETAFNDEHLSL